jgi:hypothetical protein
LSSIVVVVVVGMLLISTLVFWSWSFCLGIHGRIHLITQVNFCSFRSIRKKDLDYAIMAPTIGSFDRLPVNGHEKPQSRVGSAAQLSQVSSP